MRKFQFSMQALYDVKRAGEKQAQVHYAVARSRRELLEEQVLACRKEFTREQNRLENLARHGISVHDFQNACAYLKSMRQRSSAMEKDLAQARAAEAEKQQALRKIYRDKKALERLREKQFRTYLIEQKTQEAKETEDLLMFGMLGKLERR